jgi:hypothetical protein
MPITATCPKCRKKLSVRDELVGKKLRCPGCGNNFEATNTSADRARPALAQKEKGSGGIAISWGPVLIIAGVLLVIGGIIAFIAGPRRVRGQWEAIGSKAGDDVVNVLDHGLRVYLSNEGMWNPNKPGNDPRVEDPMFIFDPFVMSMPDRVPFRGGTNQGPYEGKYQPNSGEVEATLDVGGGMTLTGQVLPGQAKVTITGRNKDGKITVQINGKPMEIKYPPRRDE